MTGPRRFRFRFRTPVPGELALLLRTTSERDSLASACYRNALVAQAASVALETLRLVQRSRAGADSRPRPLLGTRKPEYPS
jgi:hypothetical protein